MKTLGAVIFAISTVALGCQAKPDPGMASARLQIVAKPRADLKETFVRVSVYDSAPAGAQPSGAFEHIDYANLPDIIVWLQPSGPAQTSPPAPWVTQVDPAAPSETIEAVSVGQTLIFKNSAAKPLSLYSVTDGNGFTLPAIAPGGAGEYKVRSEGMIEILADPAKPPVARVYAAPSPWVARTRSRQTVVFNNVPPGQYRAACWHWRLPGTSVDLNLPAGQVTSATLEVGIDSLNAAGSR